MQDLFNTSIKIKVNDKCPFKSRFNGQLRPLTGLTGTVSIIYIKTQKVRASFTIDNRTKSFDLHQDYFEFLS